MTKKNGSGASRGAAAGSGSGSRRERARGRHWFVGVLCLVALVMMVMQPDVIRVRCLWVELEAARGPSVDATECVRRAGHGGAGPITSQAVSGIR